MPEIIDDLTIINEALALIGAKAIMALDEETSLARQARAVYYPRRDALLGFHNWEFTKLTAPLTQVAAVSSNGYDATNKWGNGYLYAFLLPGTRLSTPRKVLTDPRRPLDPLRDFLIEGGRLYADRTPLWATFSVGAHPNTWPAPFRLAVVTYIAAGLALPVTHDKALADGLTLQAVGGPEEQGRGGLVGQAINADVSGSPNTAPLQMSDDLTTAHLS